MSDHGGGQGFYDFEPQRMPPEGTPTGRRSPTGSTRNERRLALLIALGLLLVLVVGILALVLSGGDEDLEQGTATAVVVTGAATR